ncbi:MAG TPA: ABC transporter substrate-binding protein [Chloroflexota bacterium]|nr:ABC transporter substrate-binding protein [Chloroflexota bacterium]
MPRLAMSFISSLNERTAPLFDGSVEPEGITLLTTRSPASETFWRQLKYAEFAVAEMSLSSYLIARERGADMIAIPVFPTRWFMWAELHYHVDAGITGPSDLTGKRVGLEEYQQTAALWTRGVLQHDFGVPPERVRWYVERTDALSHGGATGFTPPPGITLERVPPDESLPTMLAAHALDAAPLYGGIRREANFIDRSTRLAGPLDPAKIRPLFPDRMAEGARFQAAHGFIPASHTYVIRGDVYREHPWVALNLYQALVQAKELAHGRLEASLPAALVFGREYWAQTRRLFGDDPYPYGFHANAPMLRALVDYSHEQGLIQQRPALTDLFAPSTLEL